MPFLLGDAAAAFRDRTNALPNPGFEQTAAGDPDRPAAWSLGQYWSWDRQVAHSGKASVRVSVPGEERQITGELTVAHVPARPGQQWVLSFWARTQGSGGDWPSHMYIIQLDEKGEWSAPQISIGTRKGDNDWFPVQHSFVVAQGTRELKVYANIYRGYGTCWYDDVSLTRADPEREPCPGRARKAGDNAIEWTGRTEDGRLELQARYEGEPDRLEVSGTLRATDGAERALVVSHVLPVDLRGWQWHQDMNGSTPIEPSGVYYNSSDFGGRALSRYPICSATSGGAGLGYAFPMDLPLVAKLACEPDRGLLWHWEVGLSPDTAKFPSAAHFAFVITRTEPAEGMRSAMVRYYRLYPAFFEQRLPKHGCWWLGYDANLPDPEDFGLQFHELNGGPGLWEYDKQHGIQIYKYTEPWGAWVCFRFKNPENKGLYQAKSPEEAVALLAEALKQPADLMGIEPHTFGTLSVPTWADVVTRCALRGPRDEYYISFGYNNQNFALNCDPDLPEPNRWTVSWQHEYLEAERRSREAGNEIDGVYLDSICPWWAVRENHRREHWRYADFPLVFSHEDGRVCQLQWTEQMQFMAKMAEELRRRGKTVIANIFPDAHTWAAPYVDMFGCGEGDSSRFWRSFPWERAMALRKPISALDYELAKPDVPMDKKLTAMHRMLAWDVFPGGAPFDREHAEPLRDLYRRFIPLFRTLAEAGWQPLRHATTDAEGLWFERYGPRDGVMYLAVHNATEQPISATVRLDPAVWKPGPGGARELVAAAAVDLQGTDLRVEVPAAETRLFAVAQAP